jgi:poly [ADP-ribose] polymerase 2/3/4
VVAGLVGGAGEALPLRSVHVRATLIDLAATITLFQAYNNSSSSAMEARYVFPLPEGAAVCGFEGACHSRPCTIETDRERER